MCFYNRKWYAKSDLSFMTHRQTTQTETDGQMGGHYQMHYLPTSLSYVVNKNLSAVIALWGNIVAVDRSKWLWLTQAVGLGYLSSATQKGPLCLWSLSYQKKDGRTWSRPPFFWYDTDFLDFFFSKFLEKKLIFFFWKVSVIPKERKWARPWYDNDSGH